jgi:hypothetical protein
VADDHNPTQVRVTGIDRLLALVPVAIVLALGVRIATRPPELHPELLPRLAGCYVGPAPYQNTLLRLDASGVLRTSSGASHFKIEKLKDAMAIAPDRRLTFDSTGTGSFELDPATPLYLDIDPDLMGFRVPNIEGPFLSVRRTAC